MEKRPLGALPSPQDQRDYTVAMFMPVAESFPAEYLVDRPPSIYDQGSTSMCVAFSLAALKEQHEYRERSIQTRYSPGFIYANRKETDYQGEGMYAREALARLVQDGVCPYSDMPITSNYQSCRAWLEQKAAVREKAKPQRILSYVRAYNVADIKTMLMEMGPVALTIAVYPSFWQPPNGIVPELQPGESIQGYHAMVIVGWKIVNGREYWVVHNSWGTSWGDRGRCYIPADYKGVIECWGVTDYIPVSERGIWMDCPATILPPGRVVIPLRFVAEALNGTAEWDPVARKAIITVPPSIKAKVLELVVGNALLTVREK